MGNSRCQKGGGGLPPDTSSLISASCLPWLCAASVSDKRATALSAVLMRLLDVTACPCPATAREESLPEGRNAWEESAAPDGRQGARGLVVVDVVAADAAAKTSIVPGKAASWEPVCLIKARG